MKTSALLRFSFCMMTIVFASMPTLFSVNKTDNDDTILISPRDSGGQNGPRGIVYNPFGAYHTMECVILTSQDNYYGLVDIQITGPDQFLYQTEFDTNDGFICCPIDETEGQYYLTICTDQGFYFEGSFAL